MNEQQKLLAILAMIQYRLGNMDYSQVRRLFNAKQTYWAAKVLGQALQEEPK